MTPWVVPFCDEEQDPSGRCMRRPVTRLLGCVRHSLRPLSDPRLPLTAASRLLFARAFIRRALERRYNVREAERSTLSALQRIRDTLDQQQPDATPPQQHDQDCGSLEEDDAEGASHLKGSAQGEESSAASALII